MITNLDYNGSISSSSSSSSSLSSSSAALGNQYNDEISSAFEEGILVKLFEFNILPWITQRNKIELLNRLPLAVLCLKLFLLTNVSNKSIKIETDGSWVRVGKLFLLTKIFLYFYFYLYIDNVILYTYYTL